MKPLPEETEAKADKLLRLMKEADGGQPFITHKAAAAMGTFIIAELGKMTQQAEGTASVKQEWGTSGQIEKIYGMAYKSMGGLLRGWAAAGKVRTRKTFNEATLAKGDTRYSLADVDRLMAEAAEPDKADGKQGAA